MFFTSNKKKNNIYYSKIFFKKKVYFNFIKFNKNILKKNTYNISFLKINKINKFIHLIIFTINIILFLFIIKITLNLLINTQNNINILELSNEKKTMNITYLNTFTVNKYLFFLI